MNISDSVRHNLRHARVGHLFQERFKLIVFKQPPVPLGSWPEPAPNQISIAFPSIVDWPIQSSPGHIFEMHKESWKLLPGAVILTPKVSFMKRKIGTVVDEDLYSTIKLLAVQQHCQIPEIIHLALQDYIRRHPLGDVNPIGLERLTERDPLVLTTRQCRASMDTDFFEQ